MARAKTNALNAFRNRRMADLRQHLGLTLEDVGRHLQSDKQHVHKIESGQIQPSSDNLLLLADLLLTTTDYLLGRTDVASPLHESNLTDREREIIDAVRRGAFPPELSLLMGGKAEIKDTGEQAAKRQRQTDS